MINIAAEQIDGAVSIQCEHCGKWKEKARVSAFYCDDACRNRYHAEQRRRSRQIRSTLLHLEGLLRDMPRQGDSDEWDAVQQIKQMIKEAEYEVEA